MVHHFVSVCYVAAADLCVLSTDVIVMPCTARKHQRHVMSLTSCNHHHVAAAGFCQTRMSFYTSAHICLSAVPTQRNRASILICIHHLPLGCPAHCGPQHVWEPAQVFITVSLSCSLTHRLPLDCPAHCGPEHVWVPTQGGQLHTSSLPPVSV